jgi:hypothetical protein
MTRAGGGGLARRVYALGNFDRRKNQRNIEPAVEAATPRLECLPGAFKDAPGLGGVDYQQHGCCSTDTESVACIRRNRLTVPTNLA